MEVKTRTYFKDEYPTLNLESLYNGSEAALKQLDYILEAIISTEAPITLNLLKERLRECFNVKKISQKALDIINNELNKLGFPTTEECFDITYWSTDGYYQPMYLRTSNRTIYDIPKEELSLVLASYIDKDKENVFRNTLTFLGYEVLTEKARTQLDYVYNWMINK